MFNTSAIKDKIHGLKFIFSEPSTTFLSISTFALLLFLVSVKYIQNTTYALVVGIIGVVFFGFLFPCWILFGFRRIGQLPTKKGQDSSRKGIRTTYFIAVLATVLVFAVTWGFYLLFLFVVINLACYVWGFIENFYLVKSIYGTAGRVAKTHRGARLGLFFTIAGGYAVYLIYKVVKAFSTTSTPSTTLPFAIDQNVFDWVLSLVMFLYAFAGMGVNFLQMHSKNSSATEATSGVGRKEASIIVTLLFLTLGFHLFVDGLPAMLATLFNLGSQTGWLFDVQEGVYTIFRLTCFLPIMLVRPFQALKDTAVQK